MMDFASDLTKFGYARLGNINPDIDTLSLAKSIGKVIEIPNVRVVQSLTPKTIESATPNMYSGNYGMNKFPLHTDLAHWAIPPRYFILRAIVPDESVYTTILHHKTAIEGISNTLVSRALFQPRRKLDHKIFFLRVLKDTLFRWDQIFLLPCNKEAEYLKTHITALEDHSKMIKLHLSHPGECVIVDNWQILHGRSAVENGSQTRVIERVYIEGINN